jgi:hypothetical protein
MEQFANPPGVERVDLGKILFSEQKKGLNSEL